MSTIRWLLALGVGIPILAASGFAGDKGKVRLFILSGQSNMARLDPAVSFTPAVKKAFPNDDVVVVKSAQGGQPIRRWYRDWKAPPGAKIKPPAPGEKPGDLYDVLLKAVNKAIGVKLPDTVVFVWMQGESDAQRGAASVYADSLRGLIKQLRDDMKRPDIGVVIGRLSDFKKGTEGWDIVRAAQEKVATEDGRAVWVDTDDLNGPSNDLHYDKAGYAELGKRFAAKAVELSKR